MDRAGKLWVCAAAVMLCAAAAQASMGTVNISNIGYYNQKANVWGGGLTGKEIWSGVYTWNVVGWTGLGQYVPGWGFCLELPQEGKSGWLDLIALDQAPLPPLYGTPMGMTKADAIRELWGRFFDPAWKTGGDPGKAEAFSAAIWEIIYETDATWDVSSGTGFYATNLDATQANTWLSALDGTGPKADNLVALSRDDGQDYVVEIPEPATMLVLGLGGLLRLRKKNRFIVDDQSEGGLTRGESPFFYSINGS